MKKDTKPMPLSPRVRENNSIEAIVKEIEDIAKGHGVPLTIKACDRYSKRQKDERKLRKEIAEREKELEDLKKKRR